MTVGDTEGTEQKIRKQGIWELKVKRSGENKMDKLRKGETRVNVTIEM